MVLKSDISSGPWKKSQELLRSVLDFVLPLSCVACGRLVQNRVSFTNPYLCFECSTRLESAPAPEYIYNDVLSHIRDDRLSLTALCSRYSVTRHRDDPVLHMMHALKYRGLHRLGFYLGTEVSAILSLHAMEGYSCIVPVPIHAARQRERGYNQAQSIAEGISARMDVPVCTTLIRRTHYTASQTRKRNNERMSNVASAFQVSGAQTAVHNARILIVDDVLTTGATLNAIASTLLEAGARQVDAATVAKAE